MWRLLRRGSRNALSQAENSLSPKPGVAGSSPAGPVRLDDAEARTRASFPAPRTARTVTVALTVPVSRFSLHQPGSGMLPIAGNCAETRRGSEGGYEAPKSGARRDVPPLHHPLASGCEAGVLAHSHETVMRGARVAPLAEREGRSGGITFFLRHEHLPSARSRCAAALCGARQLHLGESVRISRAPTTSQNWSRRGGGHLSTSSSQYPRTLPDADRGWFARDLTCWLRSDR